MIGSGETVLLAKAAFLQMTLAFKSIQIYLLTPTSSMIRLIIYTNGNFKKSFFLLKQERPWTLSCITTPEDHKMT